jgi:hypothetical protein
MSHNPFGKLTIRRDDDDEETVKQVPTVNTTVQQEAKKKKVRPEENKKEVIQHKEESEEGFEVVGKAKGQKVRKANDEEGQQFDQKERKPKNKGAFQDKPPREGKRQFERQSGTGRGKEISKGGAGGHHTWGSNPKQIAKQGENDYYSNDDKWFRNALNEKKEEPKEVVAEVVKEEPVAVEEPKEEVQQETEVRDRRKKKGAVEEKQEDDLERPEGALSVAEYKELLKQKNQGLENKPKIVVKANEIDAQIKTREDNKYELGITTENKKKNIKIKEKKSDNKDIVVANFKTDDGQGDRKTYGKTKQGGKFQFSKNDFPEL